MIRRCRDDDRDDILAIVNAAAVAYRGAIPADRWHEPYMPAADLDREIAAGVEFWGYEAGGELVGVMGIQEVQDVDLIRHAYVRPDSQRGGIGGALIEHLMGGATRPVLVGTWAAADWAIGFYRRHGFVQVTPEEKTRLLRRYWDIPERQVETSVVLARAGRDARFSPAHRGGAGPLPRFTRAHRGGAGPPLVLIHGFTGTWRIWELVLPALERRHDVLAPTLPGHAGGPPIAGEISHATAADAIERAMDDIGWETAHLAGNSLGGYVALQLAARGRARSVVALAPAGGWDGDAYKEMLRDYARMHELARAAAPHADAIAATPAGRRQATEWITDRGGDLPPRLVADIIRATAGCDGAPAMLDYASREPWTLDAEHIDCPTRIVWGTADRLLPWPSAAARYRRDWLPHADWVELDGAGHCPQLDAPLETAQLILGFTS